MAQLLPDNLPDPLIAEAEFDEPVEYGAIWAFHFGSGCGCDSAVYGSHVAIVNKRVQGIGDKDTLIQWLTMMLATERYAWLIFDSDYGTEFNQIIESSLDAEEATTEIEQTILDALSVDDRITEVTSIEIVESGDNRSALVVDVRLVTFAGDFVDLTFHDIGGVEDV